jgi:hypothetical protein
MFPSKTKCFNLIIEGKLCSNVNKDQGTTTGHGNLKAFITEY